LVRPVGFVALDVYGHGRIVMVEMTEGVVHECASGEATP
jgi:hypothetical protein